MAPLRWLRPHPPPPDPREILRERPFADVADLCALEPLAEGGAHSGRAFLAVAADGRRFKLRACPGPRAARRVAGHMRRLPHVFPRLYARQGRYLLIELIPGEALGDRKALRPHAEGLGRACAEVHRLGAPRGWRGWLRGRIEALRIRLHLRRQLRSLRRRGVLDADLVRRVRAAWRVWTHRYGVPVALDLHDTHKANFMLDARGALRFVDEEGVGWSLKGMGMAKLLPRPGERRNSKRAREWEALCRGYAGVADPGFLTRDYCRFVRTVELVRSLDSKLRHERHLHRVDPELDELRGLVAEVKAGPPPSDASGAPLQGPGSP